VRRYSARLVPEQNRFLGDCINGFYEILFPVLGEELEWWYHHCLVVGDVHGEILPEAQVRTLYSEDKQQTQWRSSRGHAVPCERLPDECDQFLSKNDVNQLTVSNGVSECHGASCQLPVATGCAQYIVSRNSFHHHFRYCSGSGKSLELCGRSVLYSFCYAESFACASSSERKQCWLRYS